tara:strand:- start:638 stop:1051 length:414 start_codon:yes stop_codon:yes gene_type:complete
MIRHFNEYFEFFANFNVLGLAIGLMIGANLKDVANAFIDGLLMPFIHPIIDKITDKKGMKYTVPGIEVELDLENLVSSSIKFMALSVIIFLLLQVGIKVKKPVQWVSVRNWNEMKKSSLPKKALSSPKQNKGRTKIY